MKAANVEEFQPIMAMADCRDTEKMTISDVRIVSDEEMQRRLTKKDCFKCVFLTEENSWTPGAFSRKKRDLKQAQTADRMYREAVKAISGDGGGKGNRHKFD